MRTNVIIDADSMIYAASFSDSLKEATDKLDSKLNETLEDLEKMGFSIESFTICSGSKGNFRKYVYNQYKANRRQEPPQFLSEVHKYANNAWGSWYSFGVETDDLVASLWYKSSQNKDVYTIIVSVDKDYMQFPTTIYNYGKNEMYIISEIEAHRNFFTQMIVGDSADNIKGVKGSGKVAAKKLLDGLETKFAMIKAVYGLYKTRYKSKAQIEYRKNYSLLKLRTDVK